VRVQGVAGLGDGAAEHAPVSRTNGVLVFHVGPERMSGPVNLAAFRTGSGIGGPNAHHVQFTANCEIQKFVLKLTQIKKNEIIKYFLAFSHA